MHEERLASLEGVRWHPDVPSGTGALVLAGSSGRVDSARAELLARHGVVAESIRWFGGVGQHEGPWDIALETALGRIDRLGADCDRVVVFGTSFGSEAALLTGAHSSRVDAVVAFAPSDVVWAGVREDGSVTSHWTLGDEPLPFVPFDEDWRPDSDPPAFLGCYVASRLRYPARVEAAAIPVERIGDLVLVAGGDDQVWPAARMAREIQARRERHGLPTAVVIDPEAGHRTILPGEEPVNGGMAMRRGGTEQADRRLGAAAWAHIAPLL